MCELTVEVVKAKFPNDVIAVRELFNEYAASLGFSLDFQHFEEELLSLPGKYAEPLGTILIARKHDSYQGCVALRKIDDRFCEMKRLYVRASHRGQGIGKLLVTKVIETAREKGYLFMKLDTILWMKEAIALYKRFGFYETNAYTFNPVEGAVFMELKL